MEQFKRFVVRHLESILVGVILIAAFAGTRYIEQRTLVLNFYYLPVLVAGYWLGRRAALLAAIFAILAVVFFAVISPGRFVGDRGLLYGVVLISSWGGFLILASVAVGTLYEVHERRIRDVRNAYIGVLEILSKYLESTDRYTKGHSVRVSELAMDIASTMGLARSEVDNVRVAGLLHDIGKVEISADLLSKAADLSAEERKLLRTHTEKGAQILSTVGAVLKEAVPIVLAHHTYFLSARQSSGDELKRVPLGARVVAVADAFDAMTSDRPYRKALRPWEAVAEIKANSGKQFDPDVVAAFETVVGERLEKA